MQFAGFRPRKLYHGSGLPENQYMVIGNTKTLTEGDSTFIVPDTTAAGLDAADDPADFIYGYLVGIVLPNGLSLELATSGTDYDGTFTQNPSGSTYVSAADNMTDKKIAGVLKPAFGLIVSALLNAAQGTNAGSDLVGNYFDILTTNSRQIDQSTVSTTKAQFISLPGRSPDDPTDPNDPVTTRIMVQATQSFIAQG